MWSTAGKKGITVCNSPEYSTESVAELVFGMAVCLYRDLIECDKLVRSGKDRNGYIGSNLAGKKFGIVGLGNIGKRVAYIANAFGCKVCCYGRNRTDFPDVEFMELD